MRSALFLFVSAWMAFPLVAGVIPQGKITHQNVRADSVLPYRDGVLVRVVEGDGDRLSYARYDERETVRVEVDGMDLPMDAVLSGDGMLFAGLGDRKWVMVAEAADGRYERLGVPDVFHPKFLEDLYPTARPVLIRTNHRAAVVVAQKVVWWLDGEWKHRELPEVPAFQEQLRPGNMGNVTYYLDGQTLYAGWDKGEWGGMLASLDVGREGAEWRHLNDKKPKDDSGIQGEVGVVAILPGDADDLWVATGCGHMGINHAGIYQRDAHGKWKTWMDGISKVDDDPWKFSKHLIDAAMNRQGELHLLCEDGVFQIRGDKLERCLDAGFTEIAQKSPDGFQDIAYPEKFGITATGDIHVFTNSFGIFAYRKTDGEWSARQILVSKDTTPNLPKDKLPPSREDGK